MLYRSLLVLSLVATACAKPVSTIVEEEKATVSQATASLAAIPLAKQPVKRTRPVQKKKPMAFKVSLKRETTRTHPGYSWKNKWGPRLGKSLLGDSANSAPRRDHFDPRRRRRATK